MEHFLPAQGIDPKTFDTHKGRFKDLFFAVCTHKRKFNKIVPGIFTGDLGDLTSWKSFHTIYKDMVSRNSVDSLAILHKLFSTDSILYFLSMYHDAYFAGVAHYNRLKNAGYLVQQNGYFVDRRDPQRRFKRIKDQAISDALHILSHTNTTLLQNARDTPHPGEAHLEAIPSVSTTDIPGAHTVPQPINHDTSTHLLLPNATHENVDEVGIPTAGSRKDDPTDEAFFAVQNKLTHIDSDGNVIIAPDLSADEPVAR